MTNTKESKAYEKNVHFAALFLRSLICLIIFLFSLAVYCFVFLLAFKLKILTFCNFMSVHIA